MGQRKNLTYVIPIKTTKNIFSYSLIKITLVGRDNSFIKDALDYHEIYRIFLNSPLLYPSSSILSVLICKGYRLCPIVVRDAIARLDVS